MPPIDVKLDEKEGEDDSTPATVPLRMNYY
jgi:hypothetical protein